MRAKSRQSGMTLTELTVVIAAVALLAVLTMPAVRALLHSFESGSSTRAMISATLASARAIAAREQRYVGVRFQMANNAENPDPLKASQYMIFIIHEEPRNMGNVRDGFRAMEGLKPIKLPDSVGVTDLTHEGVVDIVQDADFSTLVNGWPITLVDTTTFSIVFSPSGKLLVHEVRVRNEDGIPDTQAQIDRTSYDDVFNKKGDVDERSQALIDMGMGNEIGMFYQDDYYGDGNLDTPAYPDLAGLGPHPDLGLGPEPSRNHFVIYDRRRFEQAYKKGQGYSGYLVQLAPIYINPYMGTLISTE